jgi:signal transduction histidine kinase/CheY-like chemotaxis protein
VSPRILLVEDDESVAQTLSTLLEAEGYQVEHAADVLTALVHIESSPIDAALLDIRVGGADGLPVLTRLKELRPDAVGIVLTGHETLEGALLALREGADDLLLKPSLDASELKASLARAVHWREVAEREAAARAAAEAAGERLRFLAGASAQLAGSLDYQGTLQSLARLAVPALAGWCAVDVVAEDGSVQRLAVVLEDPAKRELGEQLEEPHPPYHNVPRGLPRVLRTGTPELYPKKEDVLDAMARDPGHRRILEGLGISSAMIVPLTAGGRTLGALTLVRSEPGRPYAPGDLDVVLVLCRRAAMALINAGLFRDLQAQMDAHIELNAELRRLAQERDILRRGAEDRVVVLEALDRVKEEFLATASHDLKNPLTSIRGHTQLLLRRMRAPVPDLSQLPEALEVIDSQAAALTHLLDDLLDASSIQAGGLGLRLAPCDMGECLETVLGRLNPAERGRVDITLADAPLSGQWERRRIEQVLANLIGNALKYSPEGERVSVTVDRGAGEIAVAVSDRGMGIPAEELPGLFDRFHRTPQAVASGLPGTGLGLYICLGIITAHGGRIWAESPGEGQGASFRFILPLEAPP